MSQFKRKLTTFTAMLAFLSLSGAAMAVSVGDVLGNTGNVGIKGDDSRFDIDINSGKNGDVGQVDWGKFNVPGGQNVNFGFSGLSQTIINRVLGGQESQILGKLTNSCVGGGACTSFAATSKVILINPAGIMFGPGSTVDLNSFTASTFDFKGAKNLRGLSEADLAKYQSGTLNKLSPMSSVNGTGKNEGAIYFDSNYTDAFEKAGIKLKPGETQIVLDGTTFAHFNEDGTISDVNPNKSVAIVSDNIKYKDSLIRTGSNFNYITPNQNKSFSNVRLITGDGVTFTYLANGYADEYKVADDTKDVARSIDINNSGLAKDETAIKSGDVHIVNSSNNTNSDVQVKNSIIKATKLVNKENGDIMIVSPGELLVDNSRLETVPGSVEKDGVVYNTDTQNGGEVYLRAGKNVKVKDSLIHTAGAKDSTVNGANAGYVRILAGDKINIENSKSLAQGNTKIQSSNGVNIKNSLIKSENAVDDGAKNISISSSGDITSNNSIITASGNTEIKSVYSDNSLAGNVIISGDLDENGQNQSLVQADNKLSIQGSNTKIDNAGLAYKELKFYNDGTTGQNNVTIANNTTFTPIVDGKVSKDVNIETNGNLRFDNATAKVAAYSLKFDRNADGSLVDDGTSKAINYTLSFKTTDADNINAKSTEGSVIANNGTNIAANENITFTSDKKDVNVNNSTLKTSKGDINIDASKGKVLIKNNTKMNAGKDLNVIAHDTITFGAKGAQNINIDNSSNLKAGENMRFTSLGGDINSEKTTMPELTYGERLTFNAAGNNNFTSQDSLKSVNVDYIAGGANRFYTQDDIQFVNSSLKAPTNFVESGKDVILNDLTIKQATDNAKDTVTEIYANGNVTTDDVTGTAKADAAASAKIFPQSVSTDRTGKGKTVLDINQTKLKITTETVKDANNPDNGSITLDVKNANNKDAGLELVARNVDKLDQDPTGGNFKQGYYKSGTSKWDENIAPKEGPEVHLNAVDDKVAITNIYTDKLTLSEGDTIIAGKDTPDGGMPTITVKDQGGFNLDPDLDYDNDPNGFGYEKNYDSTSKVVDKKVDTDVDVKVDVDTDVVEEDNKTTATTTTTTTTTTTETTTTTTETTDKKHTIKFDNDGNPSDFILVYDKTTTDTDVDTKVTVDVDKKIDVDVVEKCPDIPDVEPKDDNIDSYINIIKLPKEQVEISKTSKVSDNTVDQTSSVMSAAAKVNLDAAAEATYTDDEDEDK